MRNKITGGGKAFLFSLALSTNLISSAVANTTNPEINVEYLNQLSGPKIVWNEASAADAAAILINGKYYKFSYDESKGYSTPFDNSSFIETKEAPQTGYDHLKPLLDWPDVVTHYRRSDFLVKDQTSSNPGIIFTTNFEDLSSTYFEGDFINNTNIALSPEHRYRNYKFFSGALASSSHCYSDYCSGDYPNFVNIYSNFVGNSVIKEDNTKYDDYSAAGGFFFHGPFGIANLYNSSFYGNYVKGKFTNAGGAVFIDIINKLNIYADNGNSIFAGNYVETTNEDGNTSKVSSAIYNAGGLITLNATNNGLIRFDDKIIGTKAKTDEHGNKYAINTPYFLGIDLENAPIIFDKQGKAYVILEEIKDPTAMTDEEFENIVSNYEQNYGLKFIKENEYYYAIGFFVLGVHDNEIIKLTHNSDGTVSLEHGLRLGDITISGDDSSQVIFNETVDALSMDISGTNVFANKGFFSNINIHDNGKLNIGANTVIDDSVVTGGSNLKIASKAIANRITVGDGGVLSVDTNGEANDTTVNSGGTLKAIVAARIHNLLANDGAKLLVDKDAIMSGNIIINAGAIMGGSYDYSKIFKTEAVEQGSLTLVGGLNQAMNQDSLVNEVANKKLNLTAGQYVVGSEQSSVKGWDKLTVSDATVKLAGNIEMANASKTVNIASDSILDLAGNSPLIATITGSLNNDGILDFHHDTDAADDITNVYGNYTAFNNARMVIDVDLINKVADQLLVDGDVSGTTKVTIYPLSDGQTEDLIKFVSAPNDNTSTGAYFTIDRVYRQALDIRDQWKIVYKDNAWHITSVTTDTTGLTNGYGSTDNGDLDVDLAEDAILPSNFPDAPTIVPTTSTTNPVSEAKVFAETLTYMSLPTAGLEQIRDLSKVVTNKVASTKYKCTNCGIYDHAYNAHPLNNAWVDIGQRKTDIDAPAEIEAKIKAVDLGFDIQSTPYNRLGVFASYRKGDYKFSGKGKNYYSTSGAELDIDSWGLGLYHRYDYKQVWTMSSIFGGIQEVDMMTNDGISSKTDGIMFGANVEAGIMFEPQKRLTLEPSVRLGYSFIKYDNMSDAYGKTAKFDNISNIEAEAGVRIEKSWIFNRRDIAKLFVKPSVIQNIGSGDVNITSLGSVNGVEDQTLIRGEAGMSIVGNNGFSGFASIGHSFGCDYRATDFNLGVGYSW